MNYYNEIDPKAAATLRELIADGLIPAGKVDERSIVDVRADELRGFRQCHFFAGGGFWSLALEWAGLGDAQGIWTGSCPCQPFSCAGAGKGTEDERHLWPVFFGLIRECRPRVVFGEQVASAAVVGKVGGCAAPPAVPVWLDGVRADVEGAGYTFGASVLGAHSVGAPHIRQRCYWVADGQWNADGTGREARIVVGGAGETRPERFGEPSAPGRKSDTNDVGYSRAVQSASREVGRRAAESGEGSVYGGPHHASSSRLEEHGVAGMGKFEQGTEQRGDARGPSASRLHDAPAVGPQDGPRVHGEHDGEIAGDGCEPLRPSDAELPDGRSEQQPGEPRSGRRGLGGSGELGGPPHSELPERRPLDCGRDEHGLDRPDGGRDEARGIPGALLETCRPSQPASGGQRADGSAPGATGHADELRTVGGASDLHDAGSQGRGRGELPKRTGKRAAGPAMPWSEYHVHRYLDGKDRRIPAEPRLFPLADDRHPLHRGRVGILRLAGNAIVPALAAEFVMAWREVVGLKSTAEGGRE